MWWKKPRDCGKGPGRPGPQQLLGTLGEFEPRNLDPVGANVRKIVLRLLHQPAFGAISEDLGQAHGHLRRYAPLFVHEFGQRGAGDSQQWPRP